MDQEPNSDAEAQQGSFTDNEVGDTRHEEKLEEERPE